MLPSHPAGNIAQPLVSHGQIGGNWNAGTTAVTIPPSSCSEESYQPYPAQQTKSYPVQQYKPYPVQAYGNGQSAQQGNMVDLCVLSAETLPGLLNSQPNLVTDKGFNGQTLLHRGALTAQAKAIRVILDHGGDPNATSNHNETPLMFACRRGHPEVIHLLISRGGRVDNVDNGGKSLVHYAAHGGTVTGLHYLSCVHNMSFRCMDKNGDTPLHIACNHGHLEATSYLLKYDRSDVFATNNLGDSVLHVAAKVGHAALCWQILEAGGGPLLHQPNQSGETPLNLAYQGTQHRFGSLQDILTYYTKHFTANSSTAPSSLGPGWVWWLLLVLPFLTYLVTLILTSCLPNYSGLFMLAGMLVTLAICLQQDHRIKHVCRWPNPMHMGMFAAGFSNTLICTYIKLLPLIYTHSVTTVYFILIYAAVLIYMYLRLLTTEPGSVKESARKRNGDQCSIVDIATGALPVEVFCRVCEILPPMRTKHCKICQVCYVDMDHHCLFLYRCVARNNHRLFIRFILLVMIAMGLFIYLSWTYVFSIYPNPLGWMGLSWYSIFWYETWVWSLVLANFASMIWGFLLLKYQLMVVSRGHTTYFQPNFGRTQLTRKERLLNGLYFLIGRRPYAADQNTKKAMEFLAQNGF